MKSADQLHLPVMLERTLDLLAPALTEPGSVIVDATLGMGGHAEQLLRLNENIRLVGVDRDPQAHAIAGERLAAFGERFIPVRAAYDDLPDALKSVGIHRVQGVLFDLGVSSLQLDAVERGFSYAKDAPLDMRMDMTSDGPTAADILQTYQASELNRIFRTYGEERFSQQIASAIVKQRAEQPLETSRQLVECIESVVPFHLRRQGHPAKRIFQALRIEVNAELDILARALPRAIEALDIAGRMVVLSYHSLEDRMVKQTFRRGAQSSAPQGLVTEPEEYKPYLKLLTRAEQATAEEIAGNPRAKSVRLRAIERIRVTPEHMRQQEVR